MSYGTEIPMERLVAQVLNLTELSMLQNEQILKMKKEIAGLKQREMTRGEI